MLAEKTRLGLAPGIRVPDPEQLELQAACRHRFELMHKKTISANMIHSTLSMTWLLDCFKGTHRQPGVETTLG